MNLRTFSAFVLAAAAPALADEIRLNIKPEDSRASQVRIITQKDPTCHSYPNPIVSVIDDDGECKAAQDLWKAWSVSGNCCKNNNLKDYAVWIENSNGWVWSDIKVDHLFEDETCFEDFGSGSNSKFLPKYQNYNSYVVQNYNMPGNRRELGWGNNGNSESSSNSQRSWNHDSTLIDQVVVNFPCQKIKALIYENNNL